MFEPGPKDHLLNNLSQVFQGEMAESLRAGAGFVEGKDFAAA